MNRRKIVVYVCAPYRAPTVHEIVENIDQAKRVAKHIWKLGVTVLCPQANSALFDGLIPDKEFLAGTMELMLRCDIVFVAGTQISDGMRGEIEQARKSGMCVLYSQAALLHKIGELTEVDSAK